VKDKGVAGDSITIAVGNDDQYGAIVGRKEPVGGWADNGFYRITIDINGYDVPDWTRCFVGGTGDGEDGFTAIQATSDGGAIVSGYTSTTDGDLVGTTSLGGDDLWIAKLKPTTGEIEWQIRPMIGCGYSLLEIPNSGGYIVSVVAGFYTPTAGSGRLLKLDLGGGIVWDKSYAGTILSIRPTKDGGYITVGNISGTGAGHGVPSDIYVMKLDDNGTVMWNKYLGGSGIGSDGQDYGYSIQETQDGGFIIGGYTNSTDGDIGNLTTRATNGAPKGDYDMWVVKLNKPVSATTAPTVQWQRCVGGSVGETLSAYVCQLADGNIIVAGTSYASDGDMSGGLLHVRSVINRDWSTGYDILVMKLDNTTGAILDRKSWGGSPSDVCTTIRATSDGGFIIGGYSTQQMQQGVLNPAPDGDAWLCYKYMRTSVGAPDYLVVKYDKNLNVQWQKVFGSPGVEAVTDISEIPSGSSKGSFYIVGITQAFEDTNPNRGDGWGHVIGYHPGGGNAQDGWVIKMGAIAP
jgi:hypothetical protein